jgi:2'-5' RNA ligase
MPYAIELCFDCASDARVRRLWEEFAEIGAPFMRDIGARPHITLAVCESVPVPATSELLDHFGSATPALPVELSSFGLFAAAEPVAFLAPKATPELLSLHARFYSEFSALAHECWTLYSPSHWVPHCTLACDFPPSKLAPAFEICRAAQLPLKCTISEIVLVEFHPITRLHATPLTNTATPDQGPAGPPGEVTASQLATALPARRTTPTPSPPSTSSSATRRRKGS